MKYCTSCKSNSECSKLGRCKMAKAEMKLVAKSSAAKRFTLGVVYEPDVKDTHGDFAKSEDIEKAAWGFMIRLQKAAQVGANLVKTALEQGEGAAWEVQVDLNAVDDDPDFAEFCKSTGLDDEHEQTGDYLGEIVESYVAPCDMTIGTETISKGTWLLGVVWTEEMFEKIEKGERTGLSMYGLTRRAKE